jgi:hypothetical protein
MHEEGGFITVLLTLTIIIIIVLVMVYLRVLKANR